MNYLIENDWIYLGIDAQQAQRLDAAWNAKRKMYKIPNNLGALRELYRLNPVPELAEYGKKKAQHKEELLKIKNSNPINYFDNRLRPYQQTDINFLSQLPHAGMFLEQRLGKTVEAILLFESEGRKKNVIVCPASLTLNWSSEVERWSNKTPYRIKGTKKERTKIYEAFKNAESGYLIISKDTLKRDVEMIEKMLLVNGLIVDECHYLNNYKSLQSKATYRLGRLANKRIALSGTPVKSSGDQIFGILHLLYPTKFSSYWQFVGRYFKTWDTPWGSREVKGYKRKEELQDILDTISVQRKRSEVMKWLPSKQYQTFEVEMDPKQRKCYKDMLDTFVVVDEDQIKVDAPSVLAQLTRLRQICLSPELLDIKAPSAKEAFIMEWLDDNNNDGCVIIFSNFTSYLKKLNKKIKGSVMIHGEMSSEQKQQSVNAIQSGKAKVLLANTISAGVGFTIDKAETVIFLDRAYTPTDNQQAEDRIIPVSEDRNHTCTVIDIVCKDSVDEKINKLLKDKRSVTEVINNYKGIGELLND